MQILGGEAVLELNYSVTSKRMLGGRGYECWEGGYQNTQVTICVGSRKGKSLRSSLKQGVFLLQ